MKDVAGNALGGDVHHGQSDVCLSVQPVEQYDDADGGHRLKPLDRALGAEAYYGVFTTNMHSDRAETAEDDAVIASALARGVPVVAARQVLKWLDGRNGCTFGSLSWSGNELSFTVVGAEGRRGLVVMLPLAGPTGNFSSVTLNGSSVQFTIETSKGVPYALFEAEFGVYQAVYAGHSPAPLGLGRRGRVMRACGRALTLSILVLLAVATLALSASTYSIQPLGALEPAESSVIRGLNVAGEVVGRAVGADGTRAFHMTRTGARRLPELPDADWSGAQAINSQGVIIGSSNRAGSVRASLWTRDGGVRDLGALPGDSGSEAFSLNEHNVVVGYSSGPDGIEAVRWTADGKIEGLGRLRKGDHSRAFAINDAGDIVGSSGSADVTRSFLWTPNGGMEDLAAMIGSIHSDAVGINSRREVVGRFKTSRGTRGFLWTPNGGMEDLGVLPGGDYSEAIAINDRSEVVGRSTTPQGLRGFLWTRSTGMVDLNSFAPVGTDFVLTAGVNINQVGAILAIGRSRSAGHGGHDHESPKPLFLLTPP